MKRIEFEDALVVEPAKVSILDELPVGAEIDYNGDVVPEGWEEVNNPNNYSTEEQVIGTWINGKPLYRKVIETKIDYSSLGQKTIEHNISNLDKCVKINYSLLNGDIWQSYNNVITALGVNRYSIVTYCSINWQEVEINFILEYTKTID